MPNLTQVQIFNPLEYPDVPSGGVSEKLVEVGTESFIQIDSLTFVTDDEARRYSPQTVCYYLNNRKFSETIRAEW